MLKLPEKEYYIAYFKTTILQTHAKKKKKNQYNSISCTFIKHSTKRLTLKNSVYEHLSIMHMIVLSYYYIPQYFSYLFFLCGMKQRARIVVSLGFKSYEHSPEIINSTKKLSVPWKGATTTVTESHFPVSKTCWCTQKEGSILNSILSQLFLAVYQYRHCKNTFVTSTTNLSSQWTTVHMKPGGCT